MNRLIMFLLALGLCGTVAADDGNDDQPWKILPELRFDIGGDAGVEDLVPLIFLGTQPMLSDSTKTSFWFLRTGPTVSSGKNSADSTDLVQAILLPGNININTSLFYSRRIKRQGLPINLVVMPIEIGIKWIAIEGDTSATLAQHCVRAGFGAQIGTVFACGIDYTLGWHNYNAFVERKYTQVFERNVTDVHYLRATAEYSIPDWKTAISLQFSALGSKSKFPTLENGNVLSIGVKKTIDLFSSLHVN